WAAWLYDLLKPYVTKVIVCDPRKNTLLKVGNKSDRIDPKKLAELLRNGALSEVYHGENGVRTLKELARSYLTISKDLGRVMTCVTQIEIWGTAFVLTAYLLFLTEAVGTYMGLYFLYRMM